MGFSCQNEVIKSIYNFVVKLWFYIFFIPKCMDFRKSKKIQEILGNPIGFLVFSWYFMIFRKFMHFGMKNPERAPPYADALPDLAGPGRRPLRLASVFYTRLRKPTRPQEFQKGQSAVWGCVPPHRLRGIIPARLLTLLTPIMVNVFPVPVCP